MPPDPRDDMAAAIAKIAAHDAAMPPAIVALAPGGSEPRKSLFAQACEQILALSQLWAKLSARVTALEAQPSARDGLAGRDGVSITGLRLDDKGHLRVSVGGIENDLGNVAGRDGRDGRGVVAARLDGDDLVLVFSDGTETNVGQITGRVIVAEPAIRGVSIEDDGHLVVTLHNGETHDAGLARGPAGDSVQGPPGEPGQSIAGERGADGRGISSADLDFEGRLVITFTDGSRDVLACVKGRDGADGLDGAPGRDGAGITTGRGVPATTAQVGDLYLDLETGNVYRFKS